MDKDFVAKKIETISGKNSFKMDEPMKDHTSFKVGGPADILVSPGKLEILIEILKECKKNQIPFFIMGNGTNLIVRDQGIRGVVIKLNENMKDYFVEDEVITADAGILLSRVSKIALRHELSGLEFASGIPGTLGGAVAMNAGAYGGEMKDVVIETQYLDHNGDIKVLRKEDHEFGYRTSRIQKEKGIVIRSKMKLLKGDKEKIQSVMAELNKKRTEKQPLEKPSAGSVFKRPEGYFAGKLIEDCGLKGCRFGGAEVSTKHSGFIINSGSATASDILNLIKHIQIKVREQFGVELQTEVLVVGEE